MKKALCVPDDLPIEVVKLLARYNMMHNDLPVEVVKLLARYNMMHDEIQNKWKRSTAL